MMNLKPFLNTTINNETRNFHLNFSNFIITGDIFIHHRNSQQITNILDIEIKTLVDLKVLTFASTRFEFLFSQF